MTEPPRKKQRRRLNYDKCRFCRKDKKACTPNGRVWPQKCHRCIELDLECSENSRAAAAPPTVAPQPIISQVSGATQTRNWHNLSLRVTWLRRLKSYQNAVDAVVKDRIPLFDLDTLYPVELDLEEMHSAIKAEEHSLYADLLGESNFSSNPLGALITLFFEPTRIPSFRQDSEYVSQEIVNSLRKSGDIGTALSIQETLFLKYDKFNREISAVELQNYYEMYSEMTERSKAIANCHVPAIPAFHSLLIQTQGKVKFPFESTQGQLIRMKDYVGRSLFHVALDLRVKEDMMRSIEFNVDLITQDHWGRWPIHVASSGNLVAVVKHLIEKKENLHREDYNQCSALCYASLVGNESIVQLLLERGADITKGHSLSHAAENGHTAVVRLLLEKGADLTEGFALDYAANNGHTAVVQLLLEKGADITEGLPLSNAAKNGHTAVVRLLLEKSPDLTEGFALDYAASKGHTAIVRLLVEKSADITKRCALNSATYYGHTAVVRLLLEKGAEITEGFSLCNAAKNGNTAVVQLLLEKGADITKGFPLSNAAENGHTAVVRLLLEKGAAIDGNGIGVKPLIAAIENGHTAIVKLMLQHGADLCIKNVKGLTPLGIAVEKGHQDIAEILQTMDHHHHHRELE